MTGRQQLPPLPPELRDQLAGLIWKSAPAGAVRTPAAHGKMDGVAPETAQTPLRATGDFE